MTRSIFASMARALVLLTFAIAGHVLAANRVIVGSTDGNLSVTQDGGAAYSIPIKLPPGTSGMEPKIALTYSSRAGKSPYGFGWNLTGLTLIQRSTRNLADDGIVRGVAFNEHDGLMLDGERLVMVVDNRKSAKPADRFVEFRTRTDSYTRIRAYDWTPAGPLKFVANTRPGLTLSFGSTANSRVAGKGGAGVPMMWLCDRVEDQAGNYMVFSYLAEAATMDYQIKKIEYTGNLKAAMLPYAAVDFEYEDLATPYEVRFLEGEAIPARKRLKRIHSRYGMQYLRTYTPTYDAATELGSNFFFLKALTETGYETGATPAQGSSTSFRPLNFSYTHAVPQWAQRPWLGDDFADLPSLGRLAEGFRAVRVNKGGKSYQAVVYRLAVGGKEIAGAYYFDPANGRWDRLAGANGKTYAPPVITADQEGMASPVAWADINGDGMEDMLVSGLSPALDGTYISSDGGWERVAALPIAIRGGSLASSGIALIKRDGAISLGWHRQVGAGAPLSGMVTLAGAAWQKSKLPAPPHPLRGDASAPDLDRVYALDVDCDGNSELVYLHPGSAGGVAVYAPTAAKWEKMAASFVPTFGTVPAHEAVQAVGTDGQCQRLMAAYQTFGQAPFRSGLIASANGWQSDAAVPPVLFWRTKSDVGEQVASVADVDGDGQPDIFAHGRSATERYAYLNQGASWVSDPSFAPPVTLLGDPKRRRGVFQTLTVANSMGTAQRRLMMFAGGGAKLSTPLIFARASGGKWEEIGDYRLPATINIAAFDKIDLGIRFVDINGDGYPDIVSAVRKVSGIESKAWIFDPKGSTKWTEKPEFALPEPLSAEDFSDTGALLIDVNGDGLTDLLVSREKVQIRYGMAPIVTLESAAYINCTKMKQAPCQTGKGIWQKNVLPGLVPTLPFSREGFGPYGVRAIDVNGDGLTDLVYSSLVEREAAVQPVPPPGGNPQDPPPPPPSPYELMATTFLNDGGKTWKADAAYALTQPIARQVLCPKKPGFDFGPPPNPLPPNPLCGNFQDDETFQNVQTMDTRLEFLDINADRLPDILYHYRTFEQVLMDDVWQIREKIASGALINTGSGWVDDARFTPPARIDSEVTFLDVNAKQVFFIDLNADGIPDFIYALKGSSRVFLGTGAGWTPANKWFALPDIAVGGGRGDLGLRFFDVNGDGLLDLVYSRTGGAHAGSGVYTNTGTSWAEGAPNMIPPVAFTEDGLGDIGVRPLDVNGDGLVDLIQFFARSGGVNDRSVFVNEAGKPGLLNRVVNGLGLVTTVSFQSYLSYDGLQAAKTAESGAAEAIVCKLPHSFVGCESSYPVIHALLPGYVVTNLETTGAGVERRTRAYTYSGYRVNVQSGRSLGFSIQETLDTQRQRIIRNEFSQTEGLVGQLMSSLTLQLYEGKDVAIASSVSGWAVEQTGGLPHPDGNPGFRPAILRALLKDRRVTSADLLGKTLNDQVDRLGYDRFGNTVLLESRYADESGMRTETSFGQESEVRWIFGRPTASTVTYFAKGTPAISRSSEFGYDPVTALQTREVSFKGTQHQLVTGIERDVFGNKTKVMVASREDGTRVQASEYDTRGRFIRTARDALDHASSFVYHEPSGVVLRKTDPNGAVVVASFDGLQVADSNMSAAGLATTYKSGNVNSVDAQEYSYWSIKQVGDMQAQLSLMDSLGRTRRKIYFVESTPGQARTDCDQYSRYASSSNGLRAVVSDIRYDRLGRVSHTTSPRFCDSNAPVTVKRFSYDDLDRVTLTRNPDGAEQQTVYSGREMTTIDAAGRRSTVTKDARGRVLLARDAMGGQVHYTYDAYGNALVLTDPSGQKIINFYDQAGNKSSTTDPASGLWKFKSSAFGELLSQTDPRGSEVKMSFDSAGRIRTRQAANATYTWVYDNCEFGKGRLCSVVTAGGESRSYRYDETGNRVRTTVRVDKDAVSTDVTFDRHGRAVNIAYSTGISVENFYNQVGALKKVSMSEAGAGKVLAEALEFDEVGRVRAELLGNGMRRSTEYTTDSNRLKSVSVMSHGEVVQDLRLSHDAVGNITSRTDKPSMLDETFGYDELSRLTSVSTQGHEKMAVAFDASGNIRNKSGVGNYEYCKQAEATRLCAVGEGPAAKSLAYDPSGNVVSYGDRTLEFNAENRVSAIERKRNAGVRLNYSEFVYGADGQLVQHESRQGAVKFKASYLGEVELLREEFAPPFLRTPERTRVRHHVAGPSGVIGFFEKTFLHHPMQFSSPFYANLLRITPERTTAQKDGGFSYFIKDHLSSLTALADGAGKVVERFAYDAWGKRIKAGGGGPYSSVRTGFSSHEQLDDLELVHMQGRIYSPELGRFMSPDVVVQFPLNTQSFNRYAYVLNNPLRFIDPSGFDLWGDIVGGLGDVLGGVLDVADAIFGKPMRWVGEQLSQAGQWIEKNWRVIVVIAVAIAAPYLLPAMSAIALGAVTGAIVGGLSAALYGGNIDDVLRGAALGAITGAITGGVAQHYGPTYSFGRVVSEGAAGGISAQIRGGNFSEGFNFAFAMAAVTYANQEMRNDQIKGSSQPRSADDSRTNLSPRGKYSKGMFGDGQKLGGTRLEPNTLDCSGGTFGGCQMDEGMIGKWKYEKGSFQDSVVESFAGPHDWLIDKTGGYYDNGFGKRFGNFFGDTAYPGIMLVPAAYFAAPAFVPVQAREEMQRRCTNAYGWCM